MPEAASAGDALTYDTAYERAVAKRRLVALAWCLVAFVVEAFGALSCAAAGNWQAASWAAVSMAWTFLAARLSCR
jgi:hypothetical protein